MSDPTPQEKNVSWRTSYWKWILLAVFVVAVGGLYVQFGDLFSLSSLAERESQLREYQQQHPVLIYGIAFAIYVMVTGLSLPGAAGLTLAYGWYFGLLPGMILVSFASTTGATIAFLISRFFFQDTIQKRFGKRLNHFNESLKKEGPFFLFTLRLIPAVPFFVINAVMGLTPIKTWTFWWVSQIGMLPGTFIYVYAGSSVPSLQQLAEDGVQAIFTPGQLTQILIAFVLLGLFPLLVRYLMKFFIKDPASLKPTEN
ncbi:MAG TPA: TVP38/TMEM64 family protein [Planctomycetaceae bacterium]|nr:TVP38/TMEM64 family protein [Planctomycetaceae bacterium]